MSKKRYAAAASSEVAGAAALSALVGGASAVEAVLAGWLAQGGATSWALLSPVTLAVAGAGSGVTFLDGRSREPGKGLERPLRYEREADAPEIAKIAVPATGAVLAASAALFGARSTVVIGAGVKEAKKHKAGLRESIISRFGSAPQRALSEDDFSSALFAHATRINGAMIGPEDLAQVEVEASNTPISSFVGGREVLMAPWSSPDARFDGVRTEGIVAVDAQGSVAAIAIDAPRATFSLADGELELPATASVVRKGITRAQPGAPIASPLAIAIVVGAEPSTNAVVSLSGRVDEAAVGALTLLGSDASRALVAGWIATGRVAFARGKEAAG